MTSRSIGGDIKDSIFYFHESWASMSIQEEPLSEDALVALFELVAAKYDLDEVRLTSRKAVRATKRMDTPGSDPKIKASTSNGDTSNHHT